MTDLMERTSDMTDTETVVPVNGTALPDLPAAIQRERAREMARSGADNGEKLGELFGRSGRWGRIQIEKAAEPEASGTPARKTAPKAKPTTVPERSSSTPVNGTARPAPSPAVRPVKPASPKPKAAPPAPAEATAKALVAVTVVAVAVVAVVTMVTSYSHTHDLAIKAGQNDLLSMILPAAVDGLVIAGSTSLLVDRHTGRSGSVLAWLAVALGLVSSMAANVVAVDPTLVDLRAVRWVMAAYAPLALAISGHLLLRMLDQPTKDGT